MESATEAVIEDAGNYSAAQSPCESGTPAHKMAESACAHIKEKEIREACITDSCAPRPQGEIRSRLETAMSAADDIVIMKAAEGGKRKCGCKNAMLAAMLHQ